MMLFCVLLTAVLGVDPLKKLPFLLSSFVRAQNIAAVWNYCHPWQFWSNSLSFSVGMLKNDLMRLFIHPVHSFFLLGYTALYDYSKRC